jgi:hypothetical protein
MITFLLFKSNILAHSTQHTAHSTQHTAHSTQHTAHSTQHTAHSTQQFKKVSPSIDLFIYEFSPN